MKTKSLVVCTLLVVLVQVASAQEDTAQDDYPMKALEEHKILKAGVGNWEADISFYMTPGEEPTKSKGQETTYMLGEFWAVSILDYEFMGKPTKGHGMIGYDPSKKKYVGNWFESASAYRSEMEGTYDKESSTATYMMKSRDSSGKEVDYKIITSQPDKNHKTFEMHMASPDDASQFVKIMDIKYTRKMRAMIR